MYLTSPAFGMAMHVHRKPPRGKLYSEPAIEKVNRLPKALWIDTRGSQFTPGSDFRPHPITTLEPALLVASGNDKQGKKDRGVIRRLLLDADRVRRAKQEMNVIPNGSLENPTYRELYWRIRGLEQTFQDNFAAAAANAKPLLEG
jgi:hypothetical protein